MLRSVSSKTVRVASVASNARISSVSFKVDNRKSNPKISSRCYTFHSPLPGLTGVNQVRLLSMTAIRFSGAQTPEPATKTTPAESPETKSSAAVSATEPAATPAAAEAAATPANTSLDVASPMGTKEELVLDFLPEKPTPTTSGLPEFSGIDPPLESLGLASWMPSGRVQYFLEMLHTSYDLPWYGAVIVTTVMIRLMVFPLVVISQRNAAKLANHAPQMKKLQDRMTDARNRGDMYDSAVAGNDLKEFMEKKKINPMKNMLPMLGQLPFFMSMFFGLRGMANLPVESFTTGGALWFTDLTVPDPYYALPFLTASTFALQLKFAADGASLESVGKTMQYVMKGMPFLLFPFTMNFPAAITFYWFTTNLISVTQAKICRTPGLKKLLKIPEIKKRPKQEGESKGFKGMRESFKETFQNMKIQSELIDRRAYDEQVFREVGEAKPKRTFKFDPTKVRRTQRKFSS